MKRKLRAEDAPPVRSLRRPRLCLRLRWLTRCVFPRQRRSKAMKAQLGAFAAARAAPAERPAKQPRVRGGGARRATCAEHALSRLPRRRLAWASTCCAPTAAALTRTRRTRSTTRTRTTARTTARRSRASGSKAWRRATRLKPRLLTRPSAPPGGGGKLPAARTLRRAGAGPPAPPPSRSWTWQARAPPRLAEPRAGS